MPRKSPKRRRRRVQEIGHAAEVTVQKDEFLVHIPGNPGEQAQLIRRLMDEGHTQGEIGKMLGLSQGHVSRRLKLLELIPELFGRVLDGSLLYRTGYALARLPEKAQREYLDREKITRVDVEARVKQEVITPEVLEVVESGPDTEACPTCGGSGKILVET